MIYTISSYVYIYICIIMSIYNISLRGTPTQAECQDVPRCAKCLEGGKKGKLTHNQQFLGPAICHCKSEPMAMHGYAWLILQAVFFGGDKPLRTAPESVVFGR